MNDTSLIRDGRIDDAAVESQIKAKGLTAPRVTPAQIDALMADVTFHTHVIPGTTTTVATAIMSNGFTLATAFSACADPANFDAEIGVEIAVSKARVTARDKLWELEGYALKKEIESLKNACAQ